MIKYLLLLILSTPAFGQEWKLLELDTFNMEIWKNEFYRDPYMQEYTTRTGRGGEEWLGGAALNFNLNLLEYKPNWNLYWDNRVHMDGTQVQVRHVGWQWDMGASAGEHVDLFYKHHSRHVMDEAPTAGYPLRDAVGIRIKIVGGRR